MLELIREVDPTIVLLGAATVAVSVLFYVVRSGAVKRSRKLSESKLGRLRSDGA